MAVPSTASASKLGPTSRASILISVTIPPRLSVHEMDPSGTSPHSTIELRSRHFCVLSRGIQAYSVTLASGQKASDDQMASEVRSERSTAVTWSDGQNIAKMELGQTAFGFKPATAVDCDHSEGVLATLKINPTDNAAQLGMVNRPLTVIIAAN